MCFTDDFQIACGKLAQYYIQEFTDISLYFPARTKEKVPLEKLYVAMKWIRCSKEQIKPGSKRKQEEKTAEDSGNVYFDYTQVFHKVYTQLLLLKYLMFHKLTITKTLFIIFYRYMVFVEALKQNIF